MNNANGARAFEARLVQVAAVQVGSRQRKELGDLAGLAASIRDVGLLHPIVVKPDNTLVAGQRRLEAVKLLGWQDVLVRVIDLEDVIRGELAENEFRKDFTPSEKVAIGLAVEELEREKAKQRQEATRAKKGQRVGANDAAQGGGNLPPPTADKGKTRDKVASRVGMSGKTYEKAKAVVEAAAEDPQRFAPIKEEMDRSGKVDKAYMRLQSKRHRVEAHISPPAYAAPSTGQGRRMRVLRNADEKLWMVATSPNRAGVELARNLEVMRARPDFVEERQAIDNFRGAAEEVKAHIETLRAHLADLEATIGAQEKEMDRKLKDALEQEHGPAFPMIQTIEYQVADDDLERQLEELPTAELISQLHSLCDGVRVQAGDTCYWGDIMLWQFAADGLPLGRGPWTRIGAFDGAPFLQGIFDGPQPASARPDAAGANVDAAKGNSAGTVDGQTGPG
jgi:ParB/RepB/Spo0J family partition protein